MRKESGKFGEEYGVISAEKHDGMKEGMFWLICNMSETAINWSEGWELFTIFAKGNSISHKDAWRLTAQKENEQLRHLDYDFYPRGRVVVRNCRATVYLNRNILEDGVLEAIMEAFCIKECKTHAEGGKHYRCYIDKGVNAHE